MSASRQAAAVEGRQPDPLGPLPIPNAEEVTTDQAMAEAPAFVQKHGMYIVSLTLNPGGGGSGANSRIASGIASSIKSGSSAASLRYSKRRLFPTSALAPPAADTASRPDANHSLEPCCPCSEVLLRRGSSSIDTSSIPGFGDDRHSDGVFRDVRILDQIGQGEHSKVFRGLWNGEDVAIKVVQCRKSDLGLDGVMGGSPMVEATLSTNVSHPNLVRPDPAVRDCALKLLCQASWVGPGPTHVGFCLLRRCPATSMPLARGPETRHGPRRRMEIRMSPGRSGWSPSSWIGAPCNRRSTAGRGSRLHGALP